MYVVLWDCVMYYWLGDPKESWIVRSFWDHLILETLNILKMEHPVSTVHRVNIVANITKLQTKYNPLQ